MAANAITVNGILRTNDPNDSTNLLAIDQTFEIQHDIARGGEIMSHSVQFTSETILEFRFEDDTVWMTDPDSMQEIFPLQYATATRDGIFTLPTSISIIDQERGVKDVLIRFFKVFSKKKVIDTVI